MTATPSAPLKGALLALLSFALFSTHDVIVKSLGGIYAPFQIIFFSVMFSFPLLSLKMIGERDDGNLRPVHPWWTALRTGSGVMASLSAFYAFSVLPMAQTYAILFSSPLLITVLAIPVLGETVRLRRWAAVIVGLIGVVIVLRPGEAALGLGHLAALGCAVFGALSSVVVRKIGRDERSAVLLIYPLLTNFVLMGALLPFVYKPVPLLHLGGFAAMSVLAFLAMLCLIFAYRQAEAAVVAPMQYSQIIWAVIFGALFFGESLDTATAVGVSIVIASGLYIVFREGRTDASENTPVLRTRAWPGAAFVPRIAALLERSRRGP